MVAHRSHPDPEITEVRITNFRTIKLTILQDALNLNLPSNPSCRANRTEKNTYR